MKHHKAHAPRTRLGLRTRTRIRTSTNKLRRTFETAHFKLSLIISHPWHGSWSRTNSSEPMKAKVVLVFWYTVRLISQSHAWYTPRLASFHLYFDKLNDLGNLELYPRKESFLVEFESSNIEQQGNGWLSSRNTEAEYGIKILTTIVSPKKS